MKNQLFIILVIICVVTHINRSVYEILKHHKKIKADKTSFIIVFTNMILLWVSWFGLSGLDENRMGLPQGIRYSGLCIVILGLFLFFSGLYTIRVLESYEGNLITHGIYSKIRHPMYLGFIFWLAGMAIYSGGIISAALGVAFIANILFWRHLEEIELNHRFHEYKEYKKTTYF